MTPEKKSAPSKIATEELVDYDFGFLDDGEFWDTSSPERQTTANRQAAEVPNVAGTNLTDDAKNKSAPSVISISSEELCVSGTDSLLGYISPVVELKTPRKRQAEEPDTNLTGAKKQKNNESIQAFEESRQKALNVMTRQLDARKQVAEKILKNLSEVIETLEDDCNVVKENE